MVEIGHGGAGERSVGGASPWMERPENSLTRLASELDRPCREWWAVLGTVTAALDGLTFCGLGIDADDGAGLDVEGLAGPLDLKYDGGKCFAL